MPNSAQYVRKELHVWSAYPMHPAIAQAIIPTPLPRTRDRKKRQNLTMSPKRPGANIARTANIPK
jgi:hypothetical protein